MRESNRRRTARGREEPEGRGSARGVWEQEERGADADTLAEPDSCVTGAKDADGARDWRVARPVVIEL